MDQARQTEKQEPRQRVALVLERDSLVAERARRMLEEEGLSVCGVSDPVLFDALRRAFPFGLFVLGIEKIEAVPSLVGERFGAPLLLLAPLDDRSMVAHLRVRAPDALLVDRALRETDGIRQALGLVASSLPAVPEETDVPDPVRGTFAPFGVSERQLQVLGRALLGETSAQIARRLYVSELTVRNHLHAIYGRVGVTGRRELLGRFVRGLLSGTA